MSSFDILIISISIIVAISFVCLMVFLIIALITVRKAVKKADQILEDAEEKMRALDPVFRLTELVGECVERKVGHFLEEEGEEQELDDGSKKWIKVALNVAQWGIIGAAIWEKIRKRR